MYVNASVISLGPKFGGLAYSFLKGGTGEVRPLPPYHPTPHVYGGFLGQCVHSTYDESTRSVVRCGEAGSSRGATGYLCGYHQSICESLSFDGRKRAQAAYVSDRDFDAETIDLIMTSERRIIDDLTESRKLMWAGDTKLKVEADRTLAPLKAGLFDGAWNDINLGTITPSYDEEED